MKATALSQPATSLLGRLVGMFQTAMDKLVPYGFEDDDGFHYGEPPRTRHMVRFRHEPSLSHARCYRTRHPQVSFHDYRIVTRAIPYR
ncbi:MAG: hypothetical protein AAB370_03620 [Verrucomicrobiota bacterium]